MTLKEMLDSVLLECGMDTVTAYVTSSRDEELRLVNLANRSARRIASGWKWSKMRKTYTFSLTSSTTYDLPEDFRELVADSTMTDSSLDYVDMHPHPSEWRNLQVNSIGSGPVYKMRIIGGSIHVYAPVSGDTVSFEYHSDYPILSATGTSKERFTADTDTFVLDDDLLMMDLIWRYKKLLGLQDWQIDLAEATSYANTVKGQEAGAKTILAGTTDTIGEPYTPLWVNNT
jgi:hypothetical protein